MKLAFEKGYLRDIDDEVIHALPVEYESDTLEDMYKYIKDHRKVSYLSINFDLNKSDVLAIDFGSHVEFCYVWGLNDANWMEFTSPVKKKTKVEEEEASKRRFAYDVLYDLKKRKELTYEEAVAIHKILGGN